MTADFKVLRSTVDDTVNHVYDDGSEFRLVHRPNHDTIYLSSHVGCALGCGMCWLTTQGQTKMTSLTEDQICDRAERLLSLSDAEFVNISFMARGDALANPNVCSELIDELVTIAHNCRLRGAVPLKHAKVSISTIFPRGVVGEDVADFLFDRFRSSPPTIYWSLYSRDPAVRAKWLPEAADPELILAGLARWQKTSFREVVVHHALIKDVNDRPEESVELASWMRDAGLQFRVNLVHYNPGPGAEAASEVYDLQRRAYSYYTAGHAKVQERVGPDVFASCGMFTAPAAV